MNLSSKIYVAGHNGMVGGAVVRHFMSLGYENIITRERSELDLANQAETRSFFADSKPDIVIMAAAKVGGIHANNTYPAMFLYENLMVATNTIDSAFRAGMERFLFLGSSCIYPKLAPLPLRETSLLTSELEPANEPYAVAKIAGLKLCEYYRKQYGVLFHSLMPTNLYGRGDNYHPENSHLLPALIRRFHEAKLANRESVTIWGTGTPRRELMNVDDLAEAITHVLSLEDPPNLINAGTGVDHSIMEIAEIVKRVVGFKGEIKTDPSKPDGTPRKLLDVSLLKKHGWSSVIPLEKGIADTYEWYLQERESGNLRSV
jgi:GDP-L-fucose synthase